MKHLDMLKLLPRRTWGGMEERLRRLELRKSHSWTDEELDLLRAQYGKVTLAEIATQTHHPIGSIQQKALKLGLGILRTRLTAFAAARALHGDHLTIRRWIKRGWLKAQTTIGGTGRTYYLIEVADLVECLKKHPEAWDARKCPDLHVRLGLTDKRGEAAMSSRPRWLQNKLVADKDRERNAEDGRKGELWTPDEDRHLIRLLRKGLTYDRIAVQMRRASRLAIDDRLRRLGPKLWAAGD